MRGWLAGMALLALGACAPAFEPRPGWPALDPLETASQLGLDPVSRPVDRAVQRNLREQPFARGTLVAFWEEGGRARSATLVPCGGAAICEGRAGGPAGRLRVTPDWHVVEGLRGRTYWLHPGGEGYVEAAGVFLPLAWDARANGTGPGFEPAMESPAPHG